jgi:hypothetical protein
MATATPPQPPPQPQDPSQSQLRAAQYNNLVNYTSLGAVILCPLLIALPPRKFDIYTVLLISSTALGGNQVLREYTGRGIRERVHTLRHLGLPSERVGEIQEQDRPLGLRGDFRTGNETTRLGSGIGSSRTADGPGTTSAVARAVQEMKAAEATQEQGQVLQEAETGEEAARRRGKADWKVARDAREKEALEEGRGYGGLIVDQIWEVWNWGRERPERPNRTEGVGKEMGIKGKGKGKEERK